MIKYLKLPVRGCIWIILLLILLLAQSIAQAATTYYVSTKGSDRNSGSIDAPFASLAFAVTAARAGDTIEMRGGNYTMSEVHIDRNRGLGGAPGQYLTIKAFEGEQPVLRPGTRWLIIEADYVWVEGLHFIMPWTCDVYGKGIRIVNNKFTGPQPKYAAILVGGSEVLIEGNVVAFDNDGGNNQDHGIYLSTGERITIRNNRISGTMGYGIHVYTEQKSSNPAVWAANPIAMRDYLIEGNFIEGSQSRSGLVIGRGRGGDYVTVENIIIRNNILVGNHDAGLFLRQGEGIKIYNNTFYGNKGASLYISEALQNVTVSNNIFSSENRKPHVVNLARSSYNIVLEHNLYNVRPRLEDIDDPSALVGNPQFVNASQGDFHLQASSPAIDKGTSIEGDFNGSAPDLGAFEFSK